MSDDLGDYTPPAGASVGLGFKKPYVPPAGGGVALGFKFIFYRPPPGERVALGFLGAYTPPAGSHVGLEFAPGESGGGGSDQYLFPSAVAAPPVEQPQVRLEFRQVSPIGWRSADVGGAPAIRNHNQIIKHGGSSFASFGRATVELWIRHLQAGGLFSQQVGRAVLTHGVRYITAAGRGDSLQLGSPWASRSPRFLAPAAIKAPEVMESHTVGGTRMLAPLGFDPLEFGSRIIPEGVTLYPRGFSGEAGSPEVWNWTTFLRPRGFETNTDHLRFGYQEVWNLRQYIIHEYDQDDGLNPPGFGRWTEIENRNKTPTTAGWLSERHGYTSIANWAWAFAPAGIEAPSAPPYYKAGSVTHKERIIPAEGLDSLASGRWHVVRNIADLVAPFGWGSHEISRPDIANRSRQYQGVGGSDVSAIGEPMVAYAIRELTFEQRYSIEPPPIALPEVKLHTRYLEDASVGDRAGAGVPEVVVRWTIITPRWAFHPPAWIGEPRLHNVTPELRTFGKSQEEFGEAGIRTQWRRVETREGDMTRWGRPIVRDRRHWVEFVGALPPPNLMPGPIVTRVGGLPDPQQCMPPSIRRDGRVESAVGTPQLNILSALPRGWDGMQVGSPAVLANSIRVEPGIGEDKFSPPTVWARNRQVSLADKGIAPATAVGTPRSDPHTIWAVMEAPEQAKRNHPPRTLHPVAGMVVGVPLVTNRHRRVRPPGVAPPGSGDGTPRQVGAPSLRRNPEWILPRGILALRVGVLSFPHTLEVSTKSDVPMSQYGRPAVARIVPPGPHLIRPGGRAPTTPPKPEVDFFVRRRGVLGWDSMAMGSRRPGDSPFMWQGLRVGPHIPNVAEGFDAQQFGQAWVSLAIRQVTAEGWVSFACEHDVSKFRERMRVSNSWDGRPPPLLLAPTGIAAPEPGTPSTRMGRHYIRPDGNAEQYRKGAPTT